MDAKQAMENMTEELDRTRFPAQARANIVTNPHDLQLGFCLGMINPRGKGKWSGTEPRLARKMAYPKYQRIWKLAQALIKASHPDFEYTSIQFNKNQKCKRHKDKYNKGKSAMIGLGNYEPMTGCLTVWSEDENMTVAHRTLHNWIIFDGSKQYHETQNWFGGDRYTIIYFSV